MAGSTQTTVAYIYKRKYADGQVGDLAMRDHVIAKMMAKQGGMSGAASTAWNYAIRYGNPQGVSGTFATAQSSASGSKGVQMVAARKKKYCIVTLDGEALSAAEDNRGAFLDLVTQETDGVIEEHGDSLAFELFRNGTGSRGVRGSISSNTVTLVTADDARNFKVGMTVVADDGTGDGSTLRSGSTTVTGVDEDAGTVTLASAAAITSFANGDHLFRAGDPGTCIEGFAAHLPLTAPVLSSDSFRGVDRGADPRRLAGARHNDTSVSAEENIGLVAVKIKQIGKKANIAALNPIRFWEAARRLNAKVTYDGGGVKATYGFEGFDVATPAGTLRVISEADCPTNRGYVLNLGTWYWKHLKPWTHFIRDDGGGVTLRMASEDSIEARGRSMGNPCCTEPGANGVFAL